MSKGSSRRARRPIPGQDGAATARFEAYYRRGTELLLAGEPEAALEPLLKARALDASHVQAALNLSGAYILTRRFKLAVPILEELSDREAENPAVWQNLGAAYLGNPVLARDESQRKAIAAFERSLALNPAMPNVAYNIGLVYRDRQEYETAASWFRRAVQANPNDRHARRLLEKVEEMALSSGEKRGDGVENVLEEE